MEIVEIKNGYAVIPLDKYNELRDVEISYAELVYRINREDILSFTQYSYTEEVGRGRYTVRIAGEDKTIENLKEINIKNAKVIEKLEEDIMKLTVPEGLRIVMKDGVFVVEYLYNDFLWIKSWRPFLTGRNDEALTFENYKDAHNGMMLQIKYSATGVRP